MWSKCVGDNSDEKLRNEENECITIRLTGIWNGLELTNK